LDPANWGRPADPVFMKIHEIMTSKVKVARPRESLQCAARAMKSLNIGALPVCDGERLIGMVTDRDITIRAVAEGTDPKEAPVEESMSSDVVYCFEDQDAQEAEQIMQDRQIRRLPVLDRNKRLVGIVSLGDLATKTHEMVEIGETLEKVSETMTPSRGTFGTAWPPIP
jgi:CBS domain-containing protein